MRVYTNQYQVNMSGKPGKRVTYNTESGVAENPEANYEGVMVKAMEKLVKQVSDMEKLTNEMSKHIEKLTAKVASLDGTQERMSNIEFRMENIHMRVEQMRHDVDITSYDAHADEDMRQWMMEEKDKDAVDTMMTGRDIARGFEDIHERRRKHNL